VPGIGFSPDKLLQGRLLIYDDAQHHRIGPNFKQLPVNRPHGVEPNTMYVGGNMHLEIKNKFPHYYPNSFGGYKPDPKYTEPPMRVDGPIGYYDYVGEGTVTDYYAQPAELFRLLNEREKDSLCRNIASSLFKVKTDEVVRNVLSHLYKVHNRLGAGVEQQLKAKQEGVKKTDMEVLVDQMNKALNPKTFISP